MRVYFTTTIPTAEGIFRDGFTDLYAVADMQGVWFADCPLDADDGFRGDVTLCLDVPEDVFRRYEWADKGRVDRRALIPASVLNQLGPPQVYDHLFAGWSRRQLLQVIRRRERAGSLGGYPSVQDMREAIAFFDRIGWLAPLKLREGGV